MKHVFSATAALAVADGTVVLPLLDVEARGGGVAMSLALGDLPPRVTSRVHVHPVVTQVTVVLAGTVVVTMKDASEPEPYTLEVPEAGAVLTRPGTFLQLANRSDRPARVLYVVTPAWVGDADYDDAVVLEADFAELARRGWRVRALECLDDVRRRRAECLARLGRATA